MKNVIKILFIILLSGCSAGEMNADYAKQAPQPISEIEDGKALTQSELEEYIAIKLQDVKELQALLFNPEIDKELKLYAQDMILKIIPDERLLKTKYQINDFKFKPQENWGNQNLGTLIQLQLQDTTLKAQVQTSVEDNEILIDYEILD